MASPAIATDSQSLIQGAATIQQQGNSAGISANQIASNVAIYIAESKLNMDYDAQYGTFYYDTNGIPAGPIQLPGNPVIATSNDTANAGLAVIINAMFQSGDTANIGQALTLYTDLSNLNIQYFNQTGSYYFNANGTPVSLTNNIQTGNMPANTPLPTIPSQIVLQGTSIYSRGIYALNQLTDALSSESDSIFQTMTANANYSRNIQDESNNMASVIAQVSTSSAGASATADVPQAVVDFMNQNNILVSGLPVTSFGTKALNQGQLNAIKAALDNASSRATDLVSQQQLQVQQMIQTYNVLIAMINSLQTAMYNTISGIAQKLGG